MNAIPAETILRAIDWNESALSDVLCHYAPYIKSLYKKSDIADKEEEYQFLSLKLLLAIKKFKILP